jgi:hypothetical protein
MMKVSLLFSSCLRRLASHSPAMLEESFRWTGFEMSVSWMSYEKKGDTSGL